MTGQVNLPETHGRWPLVAGSAVLPVAALSVSHPALRPLAALFAHQTEEWVWPGGFLPWINETVIGSDDPEFPIDRKAGLVINVGLGWALSLSALAGPAGTVALTALYVSHLGNAGLHIGWAAKHRRYDPGVATSVLTLLPAAVLGLKKLIEDPEVSRSSLKKGIVGGVAIGAGMFPAMKLRLKLRGR